MTLATLFGTLAPGVTNEHVRRKKVLLNYSWFYTVLVAYRDSVRTFTRWVPK